ncbi:MAG TPA: bifunctional folylpolyglutamate synthase/dihydrofolate synthase [Clostridiales bacterium]|nr:bifunctional folylpolyglutamate synthase/dihydrofolate synthase [Clostridiales bacterium]
MTIQETLDFIHNEKWVGSKPGLSRTRQLLHKIGDPHRKCAFVHVAGTNGKGSVSAMLASVLTHAGYRTGLYTSPYLYRFNERMQVDGRPIPDNELMEITDKIKPHVLALEDSPTEFELVTAFAFEWFAQKQCDIVALEVGMGGRLDSTNVIESPECSVITNIGLDHTKELGGTLSLIAAEKAGIIKPGRPTVLYEQTPEVTQVVTEVCRQRNSELRIADFSRIRITSDSREGQVFSYKDSGELRISLSGENQLKNAVLVLEVVEVLRENGWNISGGALSHGLAEARWPARFEIVSRDPWFVVDGGHNPQGAETVAANLKNYFPQMRTILLVGVLSDKDYTQMMDILAPAANGFVAVAPSNPRALPAAKLAKVLEKYGKPVTACSSIKEGIETAVSAAGADGVVCSVGSLYMAGETRSYFGLT